MELTDNREMVIPILAVCMLARAVSSLLCRTPVYKAIAHRLVRDFERHRT
jgi:H+/Cl- antiporter ClcA